MTCFHVWCKRTGKEGCASVPGVADALFAADETGQQRRPEGMGKDHGEVAGNWRQLFCLPHKRQQRGFWQQAEQAVYPRQIFEQLTAGRVAGNGKLCLGKCVTERPQRGRTHSGIPQPVRCQSQYILYFFVAHLRCGLLWGCGRVGMAFGFLRIRNFDARAFRMWLWIGRGFPGNRQGSCVIVQCRIGCHRRIPGGR